MHTEKRKRRGFFWVLLALCLLLAGCTGAPETESSPPPGLPAEAPDPDAEKLVISELMRKNRATLPDGDGDFPDWIELENISGEAVELTGWSLSDKEGSRGWSFPEARLGPGERLLVFASGKESQSGLHADFSLSEGETLSLYTARGTLVQSLACPELEADVSLCRSPKGLYEESLLPTPGYPNDTAGYEAWQESLRPAGPLVISEAATANFGSFPELGREDCDWVEIQNISGGPVQLGSYYLSDDRQDYRLWALPDQVLEAGERLLVRCGNTEEASGGVRAPFSLDSMSETLYLSGPDYELVDYALLRGIPYLGSYGRTEDRGGWFYFAVPTPGRENGQGFRRVSAMPEALEPDGVFEDVPSVTVHLSGPGLIRYTLDGTVPTGASPVYEGPLTLTESGIVRAVCFEEDALPSRTLTLSYILNQDHSLPVVSLVTDSAGQFNRVYANQMKGVETPGSLAFYSPEGSFRIPCGVKLYGETSLVLEKKNLSLRFRGAYGQDKLDYDLFGGGVTEFTNLVLRAGPDYFGTVIRDELCQDLALQFSDKVMALRNRYCVLYIDGKYRGIYALMEKSNEQHYASLAGVSRKSVTVLEATVSQNSSLWKDVFTFCIYSDLADPANYERLCQMVDMDSLIDWLVLEGFMGNGDLTSGNLRYCRSTENDGRWRLMFYDLDSCFYSEEHLYYDLLSDFWLGRRQLSYMVLPLMKNAEFKDAFLTRAGEALNSVFTEENLCAQIDRLAGEIRAELERDYGRFGMSTGDWEKRIESLKGIFAAPGWREAAVDHLCQIFSLSGQEAEHYFGA